MVGVSDSSLVISYLNTPLQGRERLVLLSSLPIFPARTSRVLSLSKSERRLHTSQGPSLVGRWPLVLDRMFVSSHVSPASTQKNYLWSNYFPSQIFFFFLPSDDSHFHFILETEMALLLSVVRDFCYCLLRLELKFWGERVEFEKKWKHSESCCSYFCLVICSKKRKYQSFLPKRKGGTRFSPSRCR